MPKQDGTSKDTAHSLHRESRLRLSSERRRQLTQLKEKRRELLNRIRESQYNQQLEIHRQLHELEATMDALHRGKHRNPFRSARDFKSYSEHVRRTRYLFLFINIALWVLLFALSGPATGFKVAILVMALLTTAGNVFTLFFLLGVKNRILNPVENLKNGVAEIMKGNYTVVVEPNERSEVSDLVDAFNNMAHKLYEDEKLKEEYEQNRKLLVANISHDLKTPITSIQGYIEAIGDRKDISADQLEKYLTIIHNNAQYMNRLIDDLFLFSKLDMQRLDFDFTTVDFRRYMGDLMEEFRLELSERQAELCYREELQAQAFARIDPKRFHQVVRNLIDNAVKYGPDSGLRIEARLYSQGSALCLDLLNNGPGIPANQLDHIFERFYRVDTERTKDTSSTGLGLAIARELVAAHGGTIGASSAPGASTCFTITLPSASKEDKHEEHPDH